MAEDIVLNAGVGGATLACDEASSISAGLAKYQIVKVAFGAKNLKTLVENSAGATFPVNVVGNINAISATVNAVLGAGVANIGTIQAISATVNAVLGAGVANIGNINAISATVNAVLGTGVANIGNINAISATVNAVLGAGVANIGTIQAISATANVTVFGNVSHDGIDTGSPIKIGGKGNSGEPAAVSADADRVDAWFDLLGRLVIAPWHPGELSGTATTLSATAQTAVIAAPGASLSLYICSVMATNKTVTQTRVKLKESAGATGTLKFHADCASSGGGFVWKPMRPWKLPANVALGGSVSPAASDVAIVVEYFTAA